MELFSKLKEWCGTKCISAKPSKDRQESLVFQNGKKTAFHTELKPGEVVVVTQMPESIIYPQSLMEYFPTVVMVSYKPLIVSVSDINVYRVYDIDNGNAIGSFYAIEYENRYVGCFVCNTSLVICSDKSFRFEKTDEVEIPLQPCEDGSYVLICRYDKEDRELVAKRLVKKLKNVKKPTVVHKFSKRVILDDAVDQCYELIEKK